MKAHFIFFVFLGSCGFAFGQIDFAPVSATWVAYYSCSGCNYPPPPSYYILKTKWFGRRTPPKL
ncbi:MAG: hypothetical protein ACE5FF_11025, partial [Saprospiraceae bacterium]